MKNSFPEITSSSIFSSLDIRIPKSFVPIICSHSHSIFLQLPVCIWFLRDYYGVSSIGCNFNGTLFQQTIFMMHRSLKEYSCRIPVDVPSVAPVGRLVFYILWLYFCGKFKCIVESNNSSVIFGSLRSLYFHIRI